MLLFIIAQLQTIKFIQSNQTKKKMQAQFNFKGKEMFTAANLDYEGLILPQNGAFAPTTIAKEAPPIEEDKFFQLNDLNSQNSYQISLEKSFMTEHSAVFNSELKKYLKSARKYLNETNNSSFEVFFVAIPQNCSQAACRKMIAALQAEVTHSFKQKIFNDLKKYNKLQEFFDLVVKSCSTKIALELIKLSQQLVREYEKYIEKQIGPPQLYQLMNLAFDVSKKIEGIRYLDLYCVASCCLQYKKFHLKYQKFIEIYSVTTILVVAQFFQNPYFQKQENERPKRPLSQLQVEDNQEMEEEISLEPHKKFKNLKMMQE